MTIRHLILTLNLSLELNLSLSPNMKVAQTPRLYNHAALLCALLATIMPLGLLCTKLLVAQANKLLAASSGMTSSTFPTFVALAAHGATKKSAVSSSRASDGDN